MSSSGRGQKLERRGSSFHATGAAAQEQHVAYEKRLADELETAKVSRLRHRAVRPATHNAARLEL